MTTAVAPSAPLPLPAAPASSALVHEAITPHEPLEDMTDADLGRAIAFGLTFGTVAVFVLTLGIALVARVSLGEALFVAALPAVFGGIYFGGAPVILAHLLRFEAQERRLRAEGSLNGTSRAAAAGTVG